VRPPFAVEYHHGPGTKFPQGMADDAWLEICGKNNWVAFSHDKKFDSIAVEAAAIKMHSVTAFALCGASLDSWWKLRYFVRAYDKVIEILSEKKPPFLYRISPSMKFHEVSL